MQEPFQKQFVNSFSLITAFWYFQIWRLCDKKRKYTKAALLLCSLFFFQSVKWKKHEAISWLVGVISFVHEKYVLIFFAAKMYCAELRLHASLVFNIFRGKHFFIWTLYANVDKLICASFLFVNLWSEHRTLCFIFSKFIAKILFHDLPTYCF